MRKWKLAFKLGAAFGLCFAAIETIFWIDQKTIQEETQRIKSIQADRIIPLKQLKVVADMYAVNIVDTVHKTRDKALTPDEGIKSIDTALKNIDENWSAFTNTKLTEEEAKLVKEAEAVKQAGTTAAHSAKAIMAKGDIEGLREFAAKDLYPAIDPVSGKVSELVDLQIRVADLEIKEIEKHTAEATRNSIILLTITASFIAFVVFMLVRDITKRLANAVGSLNKLAEEDMNSLQGSLDAMEQGDLTVAAFSNATTVKDENHDEIGQLSAALNKAVASVTASMTSYEAARKNLGSLIGKVTTVSNELSNASYSLNNVSEQVEQSAENISVTMVQVNGAISETAKTSQDIAHGSEQLAHDAQRAAEAMAELQYAVDDVSAKADIQQTSAQEMDKAAGVGDAAVGKIISSMSRIQGQVSNSMQVVRQLEEKQAKIGAIVQTIDEIAEQTNLLALNAAIEAARAGEQGRGFAVVADEVRKLAERAGNSTQEIRKLIDDISQNVDSVIGSMEQSTAEVDAGAANTDVAKEALAALGTKIQDVKAATEATIEVIESMATNASKVSEAIQSVAAISQETSAGAQEMSASAEELTASANEVSESVSRQSSEMQNVGRMAAELNEAASQLQSLASSFRCEESKESNLRLAA